MRHILNYCISVRACFGRLFRNEQGQGLIEYAFILLLMVVVVVLMLKGIGSTTNNSYSQVNSALKAGS